VQWVQIFLSLGKAAGLWSWPFTST
jgi:hypothetical protein